MAHNIQEFDKIVSLKKEWHDLQEILPVITFETSGLNWETEKRPLFVSCGDEHCPVDGWQAIVRADKDLVLNIPKKSYEIIQNSRVFECIENSLVGVKHTIQVAGSLANCRKIFISISLDNDQDYLVGKDKFKNFITFISSHDGSLSLSAYDCATRVCCENTLNWSLREKGILNLNVFHTKNCAVKITNMEEQIEKLLEKRVEFYSSLEYLASKPMSLDMCNKVLTGFIGAGEELSTRAQNQIEEMTGLFKHGIGNNGQTYADALNSVTQYFTREVSDNKSKLLASNMFGSSNAKKLDFFDALLDDATLDALAKRGEKLLAIQSQVVTA